MIEIKQAVKAAVEFVEELYGKDALTGFLLEEVELSADDRYWLVTVGFNFGVVQVTEPYSILGRGGTTTKPERVYKVVKVDVETGKALSVKMKKV